MAGYAAVRAPSSGVVTAKRANEGDMAMPGRPLCVVEDPAALRFEATVPESLARAFAESPAIQVRLDAAGPALTTTVAEVSPRARSRVRPGPRELGTRPRLAALRALSDDPTTQLALLREIEDVRAPPPGAPQEAKRLLHAGIASVVLMSPSEVYSAAFSPDGQRIVSASSDGTVRVWNADGSGEPLILRGHDGGVRSVAFSPDGRYLASASADKTLRVWRADGSGEPLIRPKPGHATRDALSILTTGGRVFASGRGQRPIAGEQRLTSLRSRSTARWVAGPAQAAGRPVVVGTGGW